MRWYWWLVVVWIGGPMIIIPTFCLIRRLIPLPPWEKLYRDEGEIRALRHWRAAGSPRRMVLRDPPEC